MSFLIHISIEYAGSKMESEADISLLFQQSNSLATVKVFIYAFM